MNAFDTMEILASGMNAERTRLDVTSSNMANANTTRTAEGGPYRRRDPVFMSQGFEASDFSGMLSGAVNGVEVASIEQDEQDPRKVYDPSHPDAGGDGYVHMPNISMVEEMVNMVNATRSYEAQLNAMHGLVGMSEKALTIGR